MAGQPYMQFYVGDWKRKPSLSKCTALGRAVWLELLLAMHDDHAAEVSGKAWQLALICRLPQDQFDAGLEELRENDVCDISVTDNGTVTVVSRRRAREEESRQKGRERQKRHRERVSKRAESQDCNTKTPSEDEYDSVSEDENDSVLETRAKANQGPAFDEFWDAYGHKIDRKRCAVKWSRLTAKKREAAMAHVPGYVAATNTDGSYPSRKNPLTYLNGEGWLDEDLPVAGDRKQVQKIAVPE